MDGTKGENEELLRTEVLESLKNIGCCDYRFGVGQLGLVQDVRVSEERAVSVKVLPCCIFGMTRLVTSVKEGLEGIEGIARVDVDVAWDQIGSRDRVPQDDKQPLRLDLKALAQKHGLKPWGNK
jgi:metal-sulfur cluster biosynthetic enzyme